MNKRTDFNKINTQLFLWEENVQERCPSTLYTSPDSWIASALCSKGAKQQK